MCFTKTVLEKRAVLTHLFADVFQVYKCSLKRYGDQGPPQVFAVKIFTMELQDTEVRKAVLVIMIQRRH